MKKALLLVLSLGLMGCGMNGVKNEIVQEENPSVAVDVEYPDVITRGQGLVRGDEHFFADTVMRSDVSYSYSFGLEIFKATGKDFKMTAMNFDALPPESEFDTTGKGSYASLKEGLVEGFSELDKLFVGGELGEVYKYIGSLEIYGDVGRINFLADLGEVKGVRFVVTMEGQDYNPTEGVYVSGFTKRNGKYVMLRANFRDDFTGEREVRSSSANPGMYDLGGLSAEFESCYEIGGDVIECIAKKVQADEDLLNQFRMKADEMIEFYGF